MLGGGSAYRLLFPRALEVGGGFANREVGYCHQRRHAPCKPINDRRWYDVHFSS